MGVIVITGLPFGLRVDPASRPRVKPRNPSVLSEEPSLACAALCFLSKFFLVVVLLFFLFLFFKKRRQQTSFGTPDAPLTDKQ